MLSESQKLRSFTAALQSSQQRVCAYLIKKSVVGIAQKLTSYSKKSLAHVIFPTRLHVLVKTMTASSHKKNFTKAKMSSCFVFIKKRH